MVEVLSWLHHHGVCGLLGGFAVLPGQHSETGIVQQRLLELLHLPGVRRQLCAAGGFAGDHSVDGKSAGRNGRRPGGQERPQGQKGQEGQEGQEGQQCLNGIRCLSEVRKECL